MKLKPVLAQREAFEKTARTLGADESEDKFRAKLAAVARHRPAQENTSDEDGFSVKPKRED